MTTAENKKDNQNKTIIVEMILWALFFGVVYLLTKGEF